MACLGSPAPCFEGLSLVMMLVSVLCVRVFVCVFASQHTIKGHIQVRDVDARLPKTVTLKLNLSLDSLLAHCPSPLYYWHPQITDTIPMIHVGRVLTLLCIFIITIVISRHKTARKNFHKVGGAPND